MKYLFQNLLNINAFIKIKYFFKVLTKEQKQVYYVYNNYSYIENQ